MSERFILFALAMISLGRCCLGEISFDMRTASLRLDDAGRALSLRAADGTEYVMGWPQPAFWLRTKDGVQYPVSAKKTGQTLTMTFKAHKAEFAVTEHDGFLLFDLKSLTPTEGVERFQLLNIPLQATSDQAGVINARYYDGFAVCVMAAEVNVRPFSETSGGSRGDREGCSHTFTQVADDVKVGRSAANFTATSKLDQKTGWSVRGKRFPSPLDLTGCKAIRAWVRGDGKGEALKIQLYDGGKGYRDDYVAIDFTGWRQVTLAKPALETVNYANVVTLNFYYNGLPAKETVTCLIDHVEAVFDGGRTVVLEDFDDTGSPLWGVAATALGVETLRQYGLTPARFGLLACPRARFDFTIGKFELAAGLPCPKPGGVWSKKSPWVKRSYFFLTGFSESEFDEALAIARRGNFDMILIAQSSWTKHTGHYPINEKNFPDGLPSLQRTIRRFKDAGFKVGLHYLAPSIYPPDPYLTPEPDPRLVKDKFATLAADVDEKADVIPITEPPKDFPSEDGGYEGPGAVLQIDKELIWYGARAMQPPFGFAECKRGYLGTKAAPHSRGARVAHLLKSYGYFLFDMDTSLLDEVAANFAQVANALDIDMIYWDGSERLQGDHWYYNAKLQEAFYSKLTNKNMLFQGSSHSHYSWHIIARCASADGHGDLKGYLDERSPSIYRWLRPNLMPLDIGWYYGYDAEAALDQYEYILGASIGYDSSISYQVSPKAAARQPFTGQILDLIARYEKLRLSGRVPESMKERLRIDPELGGKKSDEERAKLWDKRREYRLLGEEGKEIFQRVMYQPWREVSALDGTSNEWAMRISDVAVRAGAQDHRGLPEVRDDAKTPPNRPGEQHGGLLEVRHAASGAARVGVQLHVKPSPWLRPGPAYASPDALMLETFDDLAPYTKDPKNNFEVFVIGPGKAGATSQGVTQEFKSSDRNATEGKRCAVYTATSTLTAAGGWAAMGRRFDPPLDLSWHKGIGFWLRGDANGGSFKLQLRDDANACDHYVKNDFKGWRYQQLARPEKDTMDYTKVSYLGFYYNGLPGKTTVSCGIDDVKVLRSLDTQAVLDPCVKVGGKEVRWSGPMVAGQWLIAWPGEPVRHYEVGKGLTHRGDPAPDIVLPPGEHKVRVECKGDFPLPLQVRLTLQPPERHEIAGSGKE